MSPGSLDPGQVTLSFNAQAASGMAWGFILEATALHCVTQFGLPAEIQVGSASIASSAEAEVTKAPKRRDSVPGFLTRAAVSERCEGQAGAELRRRSWSGVLASHVSR